MNKLYRISVEDYFLGRIFVLAQSEEQAIELVRQEFKEEFFAINWIEEVDLNKTGIL